MRRACRIVVGVVLLFAPAAVLAQQPAQSFDQLKVLVSPGETLWLTDTAGSRVKGRLTRLGPDALTLDVDGQARTWEAATVRQVRHRHTDSLLNGVLIGAATGGAAYGGFAAWWCSQEPCTNGAAVANVALGAGIGALADALVKARRTVYEGPVAGSSTSFAVVPVMSPGHGGVQLSVRFR